MIWTEEKPVSPGWYWQRHLVCTKRRCRWSLPEIVYIETGQSPNRVIWYNQRPQVREDPVHTIKTQYGGPILPPDDGDLHA